MMPSDKNTKVSVVLLVQRTGIVWQYDGGLGRDTVLQLARDDLVVLLGFT